MKRRLLMTLLLFLLLPLPVFAAELPQELISSLDDPVREIVQEGEVSDANDFFAGVVSLLQSIRPELGKRLREAVKSASLLLIVVVTAGVAESVFSATSDVLHLKPVRLAGVIAMSGIALRDINGLLPTARELLTELDTFTTALLPTLFAALAATGAVTAASTQQLLTAWLSAALVRFVSETLLPLLLCYLALITASAVLPEDSLALLAEGLRKGVTWLLGGVLSAFTAYLSLSHVLSGNADALTLRLTRATLSSVVPVVGEILSGTAETVLAGAGLLKNAVGIAGLLGVVSLSLLPFFSLLAAYLCYRVSAVAASVTDGGALARYLDRLGSAFGLLLGMVGSCVLLVFISIFAAIAVVTP